jgi:hypothetical protein
MTLDRDEDAYNLIKYWATFQIGYSSQWKFRGQDLEYDSGDDDDVKIEKRRKHRNLVQRKHEEGDWIYLVGQDKFENLTAEAGAGYIEPAYKLALVALKMKIINEIKATNFVQFAEELQKAPHNSVAAKILHCDLVMDCIQNYVLGHKFPTKREREV